MHEEPLPGRLEEQMVTLRDTIAEAVEELGLYLRADLCGAWVPPRWIPAVQSGVDDLGMLVAGDESEDPFHEDPFKLILAVEIGDVAWSDRVQDPASFEQTKEFRRSLPTEHDMLMSNLKDQAKSGELFSWEDDDDV